MNDQVAFTDLLEKNHTVALRLYWDVRHRLRVIDGGNRPTHHNVAVLLIHDAFPGRKERGRIGIPATLAELAESLGLSQRGLTAYRERYRTLFESML
jgi:hypothetical protein